MRVARAIGAAIAVAVFAAVAYDYVPYADTRGGAAGAYFSVDYWEARHRFRAAAVAAGAATESHVVATDARTGDEYTVDVALVPGTDGNRSLLLHVSGTHGAEGFAGSAVQLALLQSLARQRNHNNADSGADGGAATKKNGVGVEDDDVTSTFPPNRRPSLLFVHALNPYGFAHLRRANEHNVDLNRNFLLGADEWAEVLERRGGNEYGYDDVAGPFEGGDPGLFARTTAMFQMLLPFLRFGPLAVKRALVNGQYHRPHGLFYGGRRLERSHAVFTDVVTRHVAAMGPALARFGCVDVHTGLGKQGDDALIVVPTVAPAVAAADAPPTDASSSSATEPPAPTFDRLRQLVPAWGERLQQLADATTEGYDGIRGWVAAERLLPRHLRATALSIFQEFGTVHGLLVVRGMVVETAGFFSATGRGGAGHRAGQRLCRDAFYVPTPAWHRAVVAKGTEVAVTMADVLTRGDAV